MKRYQKFFTLICCIVLAFSGCGESADVPAVQQTTMAEEDSLIQEAFPEHSQAEAEQEDVAIQPPTEEEIVAVLEAGGNAFYWCIAEAGQAETASIYAAEPLDAENVWSELSPGLFSGAALLEEKEVEDYRQLEISMDGVGYTVQISPESISIRPDTAERDSELEAAVLSILDGVTRLDCTQAAPGAASTDVAGRYVLYRAGIRVDEFGHSLEGDGWFPEVCVDFYRNGRILISNLLDAEDVPLDTVELLSLDTVESICHTHFESSCGYPWVKVFSEAELVYYYADKTLLPAWRVVGTAYDQLTGKLDAYRTDYLLDAQTGEFIRS